MSPHSLYSFFFFNDTATTEIYTLSLHDALPIWSDLDARDHSRPDAADVAEPVFPRSLIMGNARSEEHTSELQSLAYLVCRLLLEKKKNKKIISTLYSLPFLQVVSVCVSMSEHRN